MAIKKVFAAIRAEARARILKDRNFRDLRDRVEERAGERRKKLRAPARPRPAAGGIKLPGATGG